MVREHPASVKVIQCDLSDPDIRFHSLIKGILGKDQKIDGAVFSAGVQKIQPFSTLSSRDFQEIFQVNFFSTVALLRAILDRRVFSKDGGAVTIISSISSKKGEPGLSAYAASKAALDSIVRNLALEYAQRNIRINSVCPGLVRTPLLEKWASVYTDENMKIQEQKYPLGIGEPDNITDLVEFLLSNKSNWITGQNITIDGGYSL